MFQVSPKRVCLSIAIFCALVALEMNSPAVAQLIKPYGLQEMVEQSDQIVQGTCSERKVVYQGGYIATQYKVKVSEFWKGQRALSKDGEFTMTEVGGVLENFPVPIAQYVPGSSDMLPGEDVVLFLSDRKPAAKTAVKPARSPKAAMLNGASLADSPAVFGLWQGRYSVITNPVSGSKTLAHTNVSPIPGSPINTVVRQQLLQAQGLKTGANAAGAKVARKDGLIRLPVAKLQALSRQLEAAAQKARSEHETLAKDQPASANEIYQFESLDSVKARVLRFAKGQNK